MPCRAAARAKDPRGAPVSSAEDFRSVLPGVSSVTPLGGLGSGIPLRNVSFPDLGPPTSKMRRGLVISVGIVGGVSWCEVGGVGELSLSYAYSSERQGMVQGTLDLDLHWFGVTRLKLEGADL
jgi:hypothetical protein